MNPTESNSCLFNENHTEENLCVLCHANEIENHIFYVIQDLHHGEMTEEAYATWICHLLRDKINNHLACRAELYENDGIDFHDIVEEYGVFSALKLYKEQNPDCVGDLIDSEEDDMIRLLAISIITASLQLSLQDYNDWCECHPLEGDGTTSEDD